MNTSEREKLIINLARVVTGQSKLGRDEQRAITALVRSLPESGTLSDLLELVKRRSTHVLNPLVNGLAPLRSGQATAHLFEQPLLPAVVEEVEVEATLMQLEQRVAFDLECLERGIDPRPKGYA
jgi:hypothetical protein